MERPSDPGDDFGVAADEANCEDIETHEDEGRGHIDDGSPTNYATQPPNSGAHYATTSEPGWHADPVAEGNVVHNLEHGQVVVWYDPNAPDDVIEQLETYVDDAGIPMLGIPYESVPSGANFVLGAWGATQACEQVSGAVIAEFRQEYQGRGPEQVGIPTYSGSDEG
jgi:hypothetical protein